MYQNPEMPSGIAVIYQNMINGLTGAQENPVFNPIDKARSRIVITSNSMEQLLDYISKNPFSSDSGEINFFKKIKPIFHSELIFQMKLYELELDGPVAGRKLQKAFFQKELRKLQKFFSKNRVLKRYYKSGATGLDTIYFLPSKNQPVNIPGLPDCDNTLFSGYDYTFSKMMACEKLGEWIIIRLEELKNLPANLNPGKVVKPMKWTAPKAALIEIIYSLQSYGAFNNGAAGLKEVASYMQEVFGVELGNYYNSFQEIRLRKKSRTVFLDQLTEKLLRRMDEADER
jgi:hypothetical protein